MKSFGGKRVGGLEGVGEENLWLWGKKKNPSYPKRETRKKKGWWWCCVIPSPFHLSCLWRKTKEEERGKKVGRRNHQLLSLLLQEGNTTFLILDVTYLLSFFPPEAKHKKGNQTTTHKPKGSKT
jgi:hypothetical protein